MSAIKPIAITSLAEEAFVKLVRAITSGEFQPGQKLSESELARRLGIRRGPLAVALRDRGGRAPAGPKAPRIGARAQARHRSWPVARSARPARRTAGDAHTAARRERDRFRSGRDRKSTRLNSSHTDISRM